MGGETVSHMSSPPLVSHMSSPPLRILYYGRIRQRVKGQVWIHVLNCILICVLTYSVVSHSKFRNASEYTRDTYRIHAGYSRREPSLMSERSPPLPSGTHTSYLSHSPKYCSTCIWRVVPMLTTNLRTLEGGTHTIQQG